MITLLKKILIELIEKSIELIEKYQYRNVSLDEDDISKKILKSISLIDIRVKTDTGYEAVSEIHLTQPFNHYNIKTIDGLSLTCADNHILFDEYFDEVFCKELKIGDTIKTKNGNSIVKHIKREDYKSSMFDLSVDHQNHRFYTNGILSHNTISASIFMLHTILFNNDKNIMIVANKGDTSVEIVDKIKSIYSLLPFFLKPGIKTWNQKSLTFDNGCRIKTSARTKTPAIGFTIDVLYLDEFAHIPSNIIEPYYTAVFPTVSAIKNSKIIITSTPNGMNLFHKLLTNAERPAGDPQRNNYTPMRVYWYQVPGRFVTYIRLNDHKLYENKIEKDNVFNQVHNKWGADTKVEMSWSVDLQKYVIEVYNNDYCHDEDVVGFNIKTPDGKEISILELAELTTWKDEAIKDIGGEDAFNQEYGLRFVNASKSLLSENIIDHLLNNKILYEWEEIYEFEDKLNFSYENLKWVDDYDIYNPIKRKEYKIVLSIDLAEGLGQDFSVINIFRISNKSREVIDIQKEKYSSIKDFFKLEQIGIYRSNIISIKQMSELLYILAFEYFNPDNLKIVLELNNYGNTLLAELPHVFDGINDYGSSVFVRYKHRIDSPEEKVGLKVTSLKNLLIKDYQSLMLSKSFSINNEDTIREITTFVKHTTSSGNIKYAADNGNDDCVLPNTLIKTINGYKRIKDIKLGELVLTHLGNYKPVTNICKKDFDGVMHRIKFRGQPSLDITYNHPIYVPKNDYSKKNRKNYNNYNNYLKREWILPSDISNKSRCVVIKSPLYTGDVNNIKYQELFERNKYSPLSNFKIKEIELDNNFAKFLGLFLADGNSYKPSHNTYRITLAFNDKDLTLIDEMKDIINNWNLKYHVQNRNNCTTVIFYNRFLWEIFSKCYDEDKEKIFPEMLYNKLDKEKMSLVLDYWIKGDGWLCETPGKTKHYIGCSTSFQLALTMRDISISLDKHAVISYNKRHRYGKPTKSQYWVSIYEDSLERSCMRKISDFEYSSVLQRNEKYNYTGTTYNLEVEDDNSYVANGIVVHNCVMTIVNATSIFEKNEFSEMIHEWMNKHVDKEIVDYINECMKKSDYIESNDYTHFLDVKKKTLGSRTGGGYGQSKYKSSSGYGRRR